jgi:predicted RNA-binding protein with RPS1 domain
MKALIILTTFILLFSYSTNGVKVVYKSEVPEDKSGLIYYKKMGHGYLERAEKILKEAEQELIKVAEEKKAQELEIYILAEENGEMPTESQSGSKGFVILLFKLKKIQ